MTTEPLLVSGLSVEIVRKPIKNLHLGVYPPDGRVRVAVPLAVTDDAVRLAVIDKLGWIRRQQAAFIAQPRQGEREWVGGESHYLLGRRYRLRVYERDAVPSVVVDGLSWIELYVRPGATPARRAEVLLGWYRDQLREILPPLIQRWSAALGVQPREWGIKRMKTKWGTCSVDSGRVWLNLELIKKPLGCIEYVVLHELAHLVVPNHDQRFVALLNRHMPDWEARRAELNATVLPAESWGGAVETTNADAHGQGPPSTRRP